MEKADTDRKWVDNAPDNLQSALFAVRQQFIGALYERILVLEGLAEEMRRKGASTEHLHAMAAWCHRLAGTAPTLGFKKIGRKARRLESALLTACSHESAEKIWKRHEDDIEALLDRLEAVLDES